MAAAGPARSQELLPGRLHGCRVDPPPLCPHALSRGTGLEVEQPRQEPESIWNAHAAAGG